MLQKTRFAIWTIFIVFVLCLSAVNVPAAFADDDAPPTEPPVATEEATEPPAAPTEIPATQVPATEAAAEKEAVTELLTLVPDTTDIVVLDEDGNPVSLASQEATEILMEEDPMWCPEGVLPNGPGCTTNLTISALLTLMRTNAGGQFSANGVIYFERVGLTTYTTSFVLDDSAGSLGAMYDTLKNFNITLRGGWNGGATNTFHATQSSLFDNNNNVVIRVGSSGNPWTGNVTIQDIEVQDNDGGPGPINGPSVSIYTTTGNITLNDVDVDNQADGQYTAYLSSSSGNITVTNGSFFDGSGNNQGFYAQTTSGSITITGTSGAPIEFTDAQGAGTGTNYNGATLSAPVVTLTYVLADGNDANGIAISNANIVTLNNVTATNNGTDIGGGGGGGGFSNDIGSGVRINGNIGSWVSILDGTFTGNQRYGIEAFTTSIFVGSSIDACQTTSNSGGCSNVTLTNDFTPPTIALLSRTPVANGFGWNNTDVTVTWSCTDAQSGVVSPTVSVTVSSQGANQSATGTCTNKAGLTASNTVTGINIDKTAPTIAFNNRTPAPNANGWNNTNVTVNWNCSDALSGVVSATTSQTVTTEGANQSATGTCTDRAGNTASNTQNNINIDKTAPAASAVASPGPNANGWNNTNVVVTFSGTDALSGIASCSPAVTLSSEGAGQSASGTCTDNAGNVSAPATASGINIDKTAPTAFANASPAPNGNGWNNSDVTVGFTGLDGLSGIDFCDADVVLSSEGAGQSASGTCTDNAGNVSAPATASGINIDKTAPVLSLPADIAVTTSSSSAVVNYLATVTDNLDGSVTVNCLPASGSSFPIGTTTVNCSSTDQAGNTANGSFTVTVNAIAEPKVRSSAPIDFFIPITGGSPFSLNCVTPGAFSVQMGSVRLTFNNLCGFDAIAESVDSAGLPGALPNGQSFLNGVSVEVLEDGKAVNPLPDNASIVVEFEIPDGVKGELAILFWDGAKWVKADGKLNSDGRFQATVEDDGTFILVMK